ncbi:MAG: nitrate reductase molybdenum cofactor assembly chaperone [Alphaproteobacteria bacterium]|nr:nitrate reductase molybdenum cofactor assembly chaperone [Alphaproteobacteria bacterium]
MRTLKILGFLLTYPTPDHLAVLDECAALLKSERWLSSAVLKQIDVFFSDMRLKDLMDLQEEYVALFDRTPSLSLHLFEHIHGDSRDRGQALADLLRVYEEAGLFIDAVETPDYLPLFTEYTSTLGHAEASKTLGSIVNILSSLAERLRSRGSSYAQILYALVETASRSPDPSAVQAHLAQSSGSALTPEEIDQAWEEQFAFENTAQTTGQPSACPKAEDMLARINNYKDNERV